MLRLFLTLFLTLAPLIAAAQDFPKPQRTTINDYAEVLTAAQRTELHRQLKAIRDDTQVHVVAITYPSQAALSTSTAFEPFATAWFNAWAIGDDARDDGIMVLILTEDRRVRIELGSGFARDWDYAAQSIIDERMVPFLADDDWNGGLTAGIAALRPQIIDPFLAGEDAPAAGNDLPWILGGIGGFIALFFGGSWAASKLRKCPSCGERGTLQVQRTTLRPATRHSEGQERVNSTCSNCGFRDENLRRIPIQRSSSGSSGFGGGSSSGGGASGRF